MPIAYNDLLTTDEKRALIKDLYTKAMAVNDFDSCNDFIRYINDDYGKYSLDISRQQEHLRRSRSIAQPIYLCLYLVGSAILLLALKYD